MSDQQPPKQIYLQAYDSDSYDDNTWCQDKINDEDIEYILQSEYDQLKAENERLQQRIAEKETTISKLEGKVNVASDLLESISLWFYKKVGNPDPFWACQFESACKLFENSEEDNNETSNL